MKKKKSPERQFLDINNLELKMDEEDQETLILSTDIEIPNEIKKDFSSLKNNESPIMIVVNDEFNMILSRAIDRMPIREVECITMSLYDSVSLTELAKHFGVSLARAHQLKKQALNRLKMHKGFTCYILAC